MADSQHKYLIERGWSQQQIDEVIRKAHEWLRGAGYTPLTEQGHWNGIMGSTQSYHLPSREKDARGMTEAFVEMLKGGKILDASRVHKFFRPGAKDMMAASDMTTPEAIAKMMEAWNKIEAQAKKQFPNASKEELYRITKSAFESALKFKFSRPGAKATFKIEDGFYFGKGRKERFADDVTYSIAAHVGHEPVGHRSVRSLEEAKAIAKQMLASTKANAKGKPVLVEVYPVVNYSPKDAIVTLRG